MTLAEGTRLGPYEIVCAIGAGGMGEVYRARDTRLDRTVAIKVLPAAFAADPAFRDRFDREARVISSLDHEMLTGSRAFDGGSPASVMAAILKDNPRPLTTLQPLTPPALEYLVRCCLQKDPEQRIQTAHDALLQLRWIADTAVHPSPAAQSGRRWKGLLAASVVLAAVAAAAVWQARFGPAAPPPTIRFSLPDEGWGILASTPAVSHTGDRLALVVEERGVRVLKVRSLSDEKSQTLAGTAGAATPFWSPDDRRIGFFANGRLKRIQLENESRRGHLRHTFPEQRDMSGRPDDPDGIGRAPVARGRRAGRHTRRASVGRPDRPERFTRRSRPSRRTPFPGGFPHGRSSRRSPRWINGSAPQRCADGPVGTWASVVRPERPTDGAAL